MILKFRIPSLLNNPGSSPVLDEIRYCICQLSEFGLFPSFIFMVGVVYGYDMSRVLDIQK